MAPWHFTSLQSGVEFDLELELYWEINGDPITDDYEPQETSARELWDLWVERYGQDVMSIMWFVQGPGKFEFAPPSLQPQAELTETDAERGFLAYYTLPVQGDDDDPVQWARLRVVDKLWRPGQPDKGGFIQEVTGWKPSPLQSHADIRVLALAAHLRAPGE
jgi:hypothetical protein